jgi:hypothetical protein
MAHACVPAMVAVQVVKLPLKLHEMSLDGDDDVRKI